MRTVVILTVAALCLAACKKEPPAVFTSDNTESPKKKARAEASASAAASASASASAKAADDELRSMLTMKAKSIELKRPGYDAYVVVTFDMTNATSKTIAGFKGKLVFRDVFGDTVLSTPFKMEVDIPARTTKVVDPVWDWNKFDRTSNTIADFHLEKGTIEWVPEMLVFADGTKIPATLRPAPSAEPSTSTTASAAPSHAFPW